MLWQILFYDIMAKDMTLYILANPYSGQGQSSTVISQLENIYEKEQLAIFTIHRDHRDVDLFEHLLENFEKSHDQLLIVGGDGTLSRALAQLPAEIPFAYYPVGTGNDFANALQLPDLMGTIALLKNGSPREINILSYGEGVVVNSMNLGLGKWAVEKAEQSRLKRWLNHLKIGQLTYPLFAIEALFKQPKFSVTLEKSDGSQEEVSDLFLLSLANNRYFGGGVIIWPSATVFSPHIDLIWTTADNWFMRLWVVLHLLFKKHEQSPLLHHEKVTKISLKLPQTSTVEVDGELIRRDQVTLVSQKRYLYL